MSAHGRVDRPALPTPRLPRMAHLDFEKPLVELESRIRELRNVADGDAGIDAQIAELEARASTLQQDLLGELGVWEKVQPQPAPRAPVLPRLPRSASSTTCSSCTATGSSATTPP